MSSIIPGFPAYNKPPKNTAGLGFNYDRWPKGTVITLTNVPWDAAYQDGMDWDSTEDFNNYLDGVSQNVTITDAAWAKPNYPIKLPMSVNFAQQFNYIRVENPLQPSSGDYPDIKRYYYYFITSVEWGSPSATIVTVQLDVWATYIRDVDINNCYIQQGHVGIANERQMENNGRNFLTVPEGLDIGGEYQIIEKKTRYVMSSIQHSASENYETPEHDGFSVLVATTAKIDGKVLKDDGSPRLESAGGDDFQGMPSGAEYYVFKTPAEFIMFMKAYQQFPWITEAIISITAVPKAERYGYVLEQVDMSETPYPTTKTLNIFKMDARFGLGRTWTMWPNWRNSEEMLRHIPTGMRHLKKFLTSPYMMIEATTYTGSPIVMKPEMWNDPDASINEKAALVPPSQRIMFMPLSYNSRPGAIKEGSYNEELGQPTWYDDGGEYLDLATTIANFPTFAMVNNGALSFMASHHNSLAFEFSQANWSQQRAERSANTSYAQAQSGIDVTRDQGNISRTADSQSTTVANNAAWGSAGVGAVQSGIGALTSGNPIGIATGAAGIAGSMVQTSISTDAARQQQGVRAASSIASQNVSTQQQGYLADTNKNLAIAFARGDYSQAIAGISSKIQDARLTQPSTSGQMGGETFGLIHGASMLSLRWKFLDEAAIRTIGTYWLRYGYRVMQFGSVDRLSVMSNFTYWKLSETYLTGNIPEIFKATIRGILEKGITVWKDPNKIGRIPLTDNEALPGVRL